jgi:hypothetical protein
VSWPSRATVRPSKPSLLWTCPTRRDPCGSGGGPKYNRFVVKMTAKGIEGRAEGTFTEGVEQIRQYNAVLTMAGRPDDVPPAFEPAPNALEPAYPLIMMASEPLPIHATAKLVSATAMVEVEPVIRPEGTPVLGGFRKPDAIALRPGTSYQLMVTPWTDLAGNQGPLPALTINTSDSPLLPEDGFESAKDSFGGAVIVDAQQLPPITGSRSAVVYSGYPAGMFSRPYATARLSVRLAVAPGDRVVRFAVRPFAVDGWPYFSPHETDMRISVPDGPLVSAMLPQQELLPTRVEVRGPDGTVPTRLEFGETRTIELALPANPGPEVLLEVGPGARAKSCPPFLPSQVAYLVDEIRVE